MPRSKKPSRKPIEQYEHEGQTRLNNPPVGLVDPENDPDAGRESASTAGTSTRGERGWEGGTQQHAPLPPTVSGFQVRAMLEGAGL